MEVMSRHLFSKLQVWSWIARDSWMKKRELRDCAKRARIKAWARRDHAAILSPVSVSPSSTPSGKGRGDWRGERPIWRWWRDNCVKKIYFTICWWPISWDEMFGADIVDSLVTITSNSHVRNIDSAGRNAKGKCSWQLNCLECGTVLQYWKCLCFSRTA